jgi:2-oxoisovalerate dehydrogenase E1 component
MNQEFLESLSRKMLTIRKFEETLLDLFTQGKLYGTTHTSMGQEATAVASMSHISEGDIVFSNHRCHGHFIAYGGSIESLFAEVMGRKDGPCVGRGGSQHLCYNKFYTNGIQGGIVPNATGAAFSQKLLNTGGIGVVFLGDGTLGQGIVYESLNFASLFNIPILFIVEDNKYAMTTPSINAVAGSMVDRARAFGIESDEIESNDVLDLYNLFEKRFDYVRSSQRPFFQVVHTYRLGPHSKGDDFRDKYEINQWKKKDPLVIAQRYIDNKKWEQISIEVDDEIKKAVEKASLSPYEDFNKVEKDMGISILSKKSVNHDSIFNVNKQVRGVEAINNALNNILEVENTAVLMGEDILDPYGGAFKVTKGLSTKFPEHLINTPISEAAMVGIATGMAMHGIKPILEIMFGDFLTLGMDQILNHASKYRWMYNNKVKVPLIIRTPMGGRRGYGPTHSQSIEKIFMGIPGLTIIAQSNLYDSGELLKRAFFNSEDPVIFIENKALYSEHVYSVNNGRVEAFFLRMSDGMFPTFHLSLDDFSPADAVIITYGGNLNIAMEAARTLFIEDEITVDIIVTSLVSPIPIHEIISCIGECDIIATLEEGTMTHGWGSEILSQIVNDKVSQNNRRFIKFASADCPIPSNHSLENDLMPKVENIITNIRRLKNE